MSANKPISMLFLGLCLGGTAAQAADVSGGTDPEACGPMPVVSQECGYGDDKCAMAVMQRALENHNCRMRALQLRAVSPVSLPGASPQNAPVQR